MHRILLAIATLLVSATGAHAVNCDYSTDVYWTKGSEFSGYHSTWSGHWQRNYVSTCRNTVVVDMTARCAGMKFPPGIGSNGIIYKFVNGLWLFGSQPGGIHGYCGTDGRLYGLTIYP